MDWSVVDYLWIIVMFLSAVWTRIHCRVNAFISLVSKLYNAKFLQICCDEETNSSTSWMAWGWVHFHRDGIQNIASKIWKKCDASQLDESQLWLIFFTGNCNSTPSETSTSKKDTPLSGEKESPSDTSTNTQVKAALTFTSEENNQGWEWLEGEKTFWFLCFVRKVKMDPHPQRKVKWNHLLRI